MKAYDIAVKNLRQCYSDQGILAGLKHFDDYWARDSLYACWGALKLKDYEIVKRRLKEARASSARAQEDKQYFEELATKAGDKLKEAQKFIQAVQTPPFVNATVISLNPDNQSADVTDNSDSPKVILTKVKFLILVLY